MHRMRLGFGALLLVILVALVSRGSGLVEGEDTAHAPGVITFVRGGNLWVWESGRERQLTQAGLVASPRLPPDGTWVAFHRDGELWVIGRDGAGPWWVAEVAGDVSWAPSGDTLAFAAPEGVYVATVTAQGAEAPLLLAPGWASPAWAPDGAQLAIVSYKPGEQAGAGTVTIAAVPRTGGNPRVITEERYPVQSACGPLGGASHLRWSANGRWIAYYRCGLYPSLAADCNELAVVAAGGGQPVPAGVGPANPNWFAWKDGTLAYTDGLGRMAWRNKEVRVTAMPPRLPARSVTPPGNADRDPAWAPDGRRLALTRSQAKAPDRMDRPAPGQAVWVVEAATGKGQAVPGSEGGFAPQWDRSGGLLWAQVQEEAATLWYAAPSFATPGAVQVQGIDAPPVYYGQWDWRRVFDWRPGDRDG